MSNRDGKSSQRAYVGKLRIRFVFQGFSTIRVGCLFVQPPQQFWCLDWPNDLTLLPTYVESRVSRQWAKDEEDRGHHLFPDTQHSVDVTQDPLMCERNLCELADTDLTLPNNFLHSMNQMFTPKIIIYLIFSKNFISVMIFVLEKKKNVKFNLGFSKVVKNPK